MHLLNMENIFISKMTSINDTNKKNRFQITWRFEDSYLFSMKAHVIRTTVYFSKYLTMAAKSRTMKVLLKQGVKSLVSKKVESEHRKGKIIKGLRQIITR